MHEGVNIDRKGTDSAYIEYKHKSGTVANILM